ncbi:MAG: flagellar biosynthesis protein FlhB [Clostridiales bacterium]|nr:flagellar biosynthesis protein FlhB [Clostridiales bacterium]
MNEAGDRTERATPKKRRDARERGQVLKSNEVSIAACTIVMFGLMLFLWPIMTRQMMGVYTDFLSPAVIPVNAELTAPYLLSLFRRCFNTLIEITLPVLGCAVIAGFAVNIVQVGFLFTTKTLMPKLDRISPLKGFKRIFSTRTLTELLKSILKIIVLGYILYMEYIAILPNFPTYMGTNLYLSFLAIMKTAFSIALKMSLALGIIAAFDFLFQWWKYEKDLKMTKQEVKEEYKLTEGDPQIKGKIRQKQRQVSAMRMMERVPSADVIITNPTHYAIALKYEEGVDSAPIVIAKGKDYIARKIREVAREHKIQLVENKLLAQALFNICEIDEEIPAEFYQAVADILVYVYRQKNNRGVNIK